MSALQALEVVEAVVRGGRRPPRRAARAGSRGSRRGGGAERACRGRRLTLEPVRVLAERRRGRSSSCSSGGVLARAALWPRRGRCSGSRDAHGLAVRRPCDGRPPGAGRVDVDAVLGLADLELPADEGLGHRVAVPVDADVALDVDDAVVQGVDLGDPERQRPQVRPLGGEELSRRSRAGGAVGFAFTLSHQVQRLRG